MRPIEHMPIILIMAIYLPAVFLGVYLFRDIYAWSFLAMLGIFATIYYMLYPKFSTWVNSNQLIQQFFLDVGKKINWKLMAYLAVALYIGTLLIATMTVELTPLGAALRGGDWLDIAKARADFLANREGGWETLRYLAVILGRSVMPFIVVYAYCFGLKYRHLLLIGVLLCYLISLEKASALFVFIPLMMLSFQKKYWFSLGTQFVWVMILLVAWTFLAHGGLYRSDNSVSNIQMNTQATVVKDILSESAKRSGDPRRFNIYQMLSQTPYVAQSNEERGEIRCFENVLACKIKVILNRAFWIPYITAYDWLKFHDDILGGKLQYGRSIRIVAFMLGESRLDLEGMVYEYEFGTPPGGAGRSNTIFLVDAKLAWGWFGVFLYSLFAVLCAALILSSKNEIAKIASVSSFLTLSVSSLTATLLSGGMFFYILICLVHTNLNHEAS